MLKSLMYLEPNIKVLTYANLSNFSTLKVGGRAKYVVIVYSVLYLLRVSRFCSDHHIKYKVIGFGANLIFSDAGFDGVVIVNYSDKLILVGNYILAESGASISSLITKSYNLGLGGLEDLAGIPSTLGGAVTNSLASGDSSISNLVVKVEVYKKSDLTKKIILFNEQCNFSYRNSLFKSNEYIITRVLLRLTPSSEQNIYNRIKSATKKKLSSQPLNYPSAGSIFKRDGNKIPSLIIDKLGLKGLSSGGAMVSRKHAGFIINYKNASAFDVSNLISKIKNIVKERLNICLSTEVEMVNS